MSRLPEKEVLRLLVTQAEAIRRYEIFMHGKNSKKT